MCEVFRDSCCCVELRENECRGPPSAKVLPETDSSLQSHQLSRRRSIRPAPWGSAQKHRKCTSSNEQVSGALRHHLPSDIPCVLYSNPLPTLPHSLLSHARAVQRCFKRSQFKHCSPESFVSKHARCWRVVSITELLSVQQMLQVFWVRTELDAKSQLRSQPFQVFIWPAKIFRITTRHAKASRMRDASPWLGVLDFPNGTPTLQEHQKSTHGVPEVKILISCQHNQKKLEVLPTYRRLRRLVSSHFACPTCSPS